MIILTLIVIFGAGVLFLGKGAGLLVHGSSAIARWFGISSLVVGLTVVAMGTSMPEFVVSTLAAIRGSGDLAIGNILGSNIANILLILGIAAVITSLAVQSSTVWKEIPFSLLAVVVLGILANDLFFGDGGTNLIGRGNGLVLLGFFILYLYYVVGLAGQKKTPRDALLEFRMSMRARAHRHPMPRLIAEVIGGLGLLVLGGQAIVESGAGLARLAGISEATIGLTLVAVGTSLPELAATVVAVRRREVDIAVGNIVGSNIFNIFFVLGGAAAIRALPFRAALNTDLWLVIVTSLVLFGAILFLGKRFVVTRGNGVLFLALYVLYIAFLVIRERGGVL